jgi:hypothetical protein
MVDAEQEKPVAEKPKRGPKVRALETGFYGGHLRDKDAEFRIRPDEKVATWMELLPSAEASD